MSALFSSSRIKLLIVARFLTADMLYTCGRENRKCHFYIHLKPPGFQ
ncbi:rCG36960, partial [Rattus norvegicus]